jgi:hypothetical protein
MYINSRRNGGEGHDVRRETFTGGVVHRTREASKETKPARRTLLGFIFYKVVSARDRHTQWLFQPTSSHTGGH